MEGYSSRPRYVLPPVPLACRIRNATVAVGGFGGAAAVIAAYLAAHAILSDYWFYPAGVAVLGVICAALALMGKAWPKPWGPAGQAQRDGQAPAEDGRNRKFGSPARS